MSENGTDAKRGFSTFGGVFTPCTLTILGVIMFLRFGQVVGRAGIVQALVIVLIAKAITLLTTLSLSAIATNTRVKGGGAYYLISRSLGVEFGGAIGVVFFLAQAISVAMYVIGFTEAFVDTLPHLAGHSTEIATAVNLAVFACVYIGAGWTIKMQYGILAVLVLSLVSFFVGAAADFDPAIASANMVPHYGPSDGFFTMFALFFPAVTGIMAGANMSGDLRDPAKSIPRGTLAAVFVTGLVYAAQAVMLGGSRSHGDLVENNLVIGDIAWIPALITAGVFAATLSSALGSMMGAPRILQAFARDEVFRPLDFFASGSGSTDEPRRATVLTFVVAQACILLGDLNAIAPVITMAFMITYGTLNLATFYEAITGNPSYRPRFRYCHWSASLAGATGCVAVMFLIDPIWAAVSILGMIALHWYIGKREIEARWGDLQSGIQFERTRKGLLKLEGQLRHPKNWRPVILALSGGAWTRPRLAIYAHWLTSGHGLLTLAQIIPGEVEDQLERRSAQEDILRRFIAEEELQAFPAVVVSEFLSGGIESLLQCQGIGALRPNTVMLGWPRDEDRAETFGTHLRLIAGLGCSIVTARLLDEEQDDDDPDAHWEVPVGSIDVWWRGMANGQLMLLLAHLVHQNPEWRSRPIRLLRILDNEAGVDDVRKHLLELSAGSRIPAEPIALVSDGVAATIQHESRAAAIAIVGFEPPEEGHELAFWRAMDGLVADLPRVLFVRSAGGVSLES